MKLKEIRNYWFAHVVILYIATFSACNSPTGDSSNDWHYLFDGKDISQWDTYLGPRFRQDSISTAFIADGEPIGLNNDPASVFSIIDVDGKRVLRISGEIWGGISTKNQFRDYHLKLDFKWGEKKWPPRKNRKRDSGLLYHAVGPHGADYGFWMRSQELQIMEGDCGDYWGVAGAIFDIPAQLNEDSLYVYSHEGEMLSFLDQTEVGRHCIKSVDAEKPYGEWNTIELYVLDDKSIHVVNGSVNMRLYNSRQKDGDLEIPLVEGKIQIQSEGAEVYYRDIRIRKINEFPANLLID